MTLCEDGGPAKNHWFCSRAEMEEMLKSRAFRRAGFWSVCDKSTKTFQMKQGSRVDAQCYRYYN